MVDTAISRRVRTAAASDGAAGRNRVGVRASVALAAGAAAAALSRTLGTGGGTIVGGRLALALDPDVLRKLGTDRAVVLVTGTNGKTTTTAMITAALCTRGPVATNGGGSNMTDGLVAGLAAERGATRAVLEVDELHVPSVLASLRPEVVVLLNLTRDQLDRTGEVHHVVTSLRDALARHDGVLVVANADDPAVVAAVPDGARAVWVSMGGTWRHDTVVCPRCSELLERRGDEWSCPCGLRRPVPDWSVDAVGFTGPGGAHGTLEPDLPGAFNRANALVAVAVADHHGVSLGRSVAAVERLQEVSGRYRVHRVGDRAVRLLLTKNPAGATEVITMIGGTRSEVVIVANAREADGRDLSWLWDVPFELLAGREVTASGERALDLAVRLTYAGVPHRVVPDPAAAIASATAPEVDVLASYSAFRGLLGRLDRAP